MSVTRTFTVTVVSTDSGNKYFIDGVQQKTLNLIEGKTYEFDQSDSSNNTHPLRFSTTSDGTHSGGDEYTTGVTTNGTPGSSGAYTRITVAASAPTLYYYCTNHSGMGGLANTLTSSVTRAYDVTVVSTGSGNKYFIDGVQQDTLYLGETGTYYFDQSASSNDGHPFRFSTTSDGTHSGGDEYTTGVTTSGTPGQAGAYTQIIVADSASTLYYYCTNHSGMGGTANTPGGNTWGVFQWSQNNWGSQDRVETSLTGVSATSSTGSPNVLTEINTGWGQDTWGNETWGQSGLVVPLTGLSATTAIGSLTVVQEPGWGTLDWGENSWGNVTGTEETLTGLSAIAAVGAIAPADVMGLTGVSATGAVGSPVARSDNTTTLTGQAATSAVGAVLIGTGVSLTGLSATAAVGTPIVTGGLTETLTGVAATSAAGILSISSNPTVQPTGLSATSAVGAITPSDQTMGLTGVSATAATGAITPPDQTMGLTGVSATVTVSPIGVAPIGWGRVTAAQTGNYSKKTAAQTGNWTRVTK